MVYNAGFIHCLVRSLASRCPSYVPRLRWRRMGQRSTISKRGGGAPACKERAYWGIYTPPDLVVSEKTSIEREKFDFLSAILLCLPSSWSRPSSRGVLDALLALHSQKKGKDGGIPDFSTNPSRSDRPSAINLGYLQLTFKTRWSIGISHAGHPLTQTRRSSSLPTARQRSGSALEREGLYMEVLLSLDCT